MAKKRTTAVTKGVFTDKKPVEIWTDEYYQAVVKGLSKCAGQSYFDQVTKLYERVVEGSLIVSKDIIEKS